MSKSKTRKYRLQCVSLTGTPTMVQLQNYIVSLHSQMRLANVVLGGYEYEIVELNKKVSKLEEEKYPPMDKMTELPVVPLEDLPFKSEEN